MVVELLLTEGINACQGEFFSLWRLGRELGQFQGFALAVMSRYMDPRATTKRILRSGAKQPSPTPARGCYGGSAL